MRKRYREKERKMRKRYREKERKMRKRKVIDG